jgi:Virulence-associated protein E
MKKPNKVETKLEDFPLALAPLCQIDHWVIWRWEERKGKWTKPPYMAKAPKRKAKNNDPATWASYQTAVAAADKADGIGFALLDTPFVAIDLDHCVDGDAIDPWAKDWIEEANGAYVERTPSGEGLRIIGIGSGEKLHRKWTIDGAREGAAIEVYRGCERYITVTGAQLGDCKELSELDLLDKIAASYDQKKKPNGKGFDFNKAGTQIDYDEIIRSGAPNGRRSELFQACVWHLAAKGLSVEKIIATFGQYPNGIGAKYAGRLQAEVERSFSKWQADRTIPAADTEEEPEELLYWDEVDKNGKPKSTYINTKLAITVLSISCRYDAFHNRFLVEGKIIKKGRINLDHIVREVRDKIHRAYQFDPGLKHTQDAIVALCLENQFDPVLDYLNALQWDGTPRLDRWLSIYAGAADTPLNHEFGRLALIAAVRRVRRPGTKFDPIIVLEGKMGTGKSTVFVTLAGAENHSDQTILGKHDREQQELLGGVWIFEIADLADMRKTDVEHLKAFASRTHDRAREAYGHFRTDQPRRGIIGATTNHDRYLKEADRRFWPVKTGVIDIEALQRDRDQLWAEAAQRESEGASLVLQRGLWEAAGTEQQEREEGDPWDDVLSQAIGEVEQGEERIASTDLLSTVLRIDISKQRDIDYKRLGRCMRRLGWSGPKKTVIVGKHVKGYARPWTG